MKYAIWGEEGIDQATKDQMEAACSVPVVLKGALMPDAHLGYGLPIGGVIGCDNAVIPYAVGVDIACRMKLSVLDIGMKGHVPGFNANVLAPILEEETRFGMGAHFEDGKRRWHRVLADQLWQDIDVLSENFDRAGQQLGTSGGGNHFVEFGVVSGMGDGDKLAILSHSGSRGVGFQVCKKYSEIAKQEQPDAGHMGWLSLDSDAGQEYWAAMNLMGEYASANHECIHDALVAQLRTKVTYSVENHHNFAWKERHGGRDMIVHRKGATPANQGEIGVIPGTMAEPTHIVYGKGHPDSMCSAAHGAGRAMSRTKAKKLYGPDEEVYRHAVERKGVHVISAGLDELPGSYKRIEDVMKAQEDLVAPWFTFMPTVVKMAGK